MTIQHRMTTTGQVESGLGDLLLTMFDAGVALGMGHACAPPVNATTALLIDTVRDRWFTELEASRAWQRADTPVLTPAEIPAWLRAQQERAVLPTTPPQQLRSRAVSAPPPGDDCPPDCPDGCPIHGH